MQQVPKESPCRPACPLSRVTPALTSFSATGPGRPGCGGCGQAPVGPTRTSGPPGPWPYPRSRAVEPEPRSAPRLRRDWFHGLRAPHQPRPRASARAMGRFRGARGRLPRGGMRAPPGRRAKGAFPGAGRGTRAVARAGSGALRSARPGGAALAWLLDRGRETAQDRTFLEARPKPPLRSGLPGPPRFVR